VPVSRLRIALKCGGSDAYSGITANPALGAAADRLVGLGGTAILGETPEIYGAEHLLAARAAEPAVAEALLGRVAWWRRHTGEAGARLDDNPSPGNKAGGLTTIREKSLGAVAKSGTSPLTAVYDYARPVTGRGLVFMDTPGYDPVSVTGMVAGGAHVVCFTTGRGSVYGSKPAPTIKLTTTSELYTRMTDDMDIDCGPVLTGGIDIAEMGNRIFDRIVDVASGTLTASERIGMGDEEFAPWRYGVTL
jgi:altronate hydrolase